ncbi:MAG: response regulator [Steroidobacteraceae bacterium]|jgi:CheY-like chemotaxis protein
MKSAPVTILLVEDDDIDAMTVKRGLAATSISNPLVRAHDGVEALEMLLGTQGKTKLNPPYLLLVDIRMPRLDGLGLVRAIRSNPLLQRTVVFMLTTSDSDRDQAAAYDSHVAGYIVKSNARDHFVRLAHMLEYYLLIVSPPRMASMA